MQLYRLSGPLIPRRIRYDYIDADGYRANVGIVLMNDDRQVFIGGRVRARGWQFPQGGIRRGERPEERSTANSRRRWG